MRKKLEENINKGFLVYEKYKWLINSYVLDFFTEEHWSKLPASWKAMNNLSVNEIAELLDQNENSKLFYLIYHNISLMILIFRTFIFPLSILSLKAIFRSVNLSRTTNMRIHSSCDIVQDEKLMKMFWKNVKLKKRHEILVMSELCRDLAMKSGCEYIVDIGSGLGHLSRMLTYGYNFEVCSIEAQAELTDQARILSENFDKFFMRMSGIHKEARHINMRVEPNITGEEFLNVICKSFGVKKTNLKFGLVGLHPCGDLGPTLIRLYNEITNIRYINVAGCCYMKLSTIDSFQPGFPMSEYCRQRNYDLCYHSKEVACHAIENYIEKLKQGEFWKLKIHAYRATIEKILAKIDPQYRHIPLANVKYARDLDFPHYCEKATSKLLGNIIDPQYLEDSDIKECLEQWNSVVIFYSFRLFFAPLIESIILYDRLLSVIEKGTNGNLILAFDNKVSPRMHVLQAFKFN